jgi:hypothetical protein
MKGLAYMTTPAGCGVPGEPGRRMIPPDDQTSPGACDADPGCQHAPCFQVQLEASGRGPERRQANACAYHVAEVIQALRAWAAEHGVVDGALTILAIEPAAGGRRPGGSDQPRDPGYPDLQGFPFSRIPLGSP